MKTINKYISRSDFFVTNSNIKINKGQYFTKKELLKLGFDNNEINDKSLFKNLNAEQFEIFLKLGRHYNI